MKRKVYSEDFKRKAVARLAHEYGSVIAKDLNIHNSMLYNWKKKLKKKSATSKPKDAKKPAIDVHVQSAIVYLRKGCKHDKPRITRLMAELALAALEGDL